MTPSCRKWIVRESFAFKSHVCALISFLSIYIIIIIIIGSFDGMLFGVGLVAK
jgi:hypothetical protein